MLKIIQWSDELNKQGVDYLKQRYETCMFMLANLREHGCTKNNHPNSGDFYLIMDGHNICGAFSLVSRGNLLFQFDERVNIQSVLSFLEENVRTRLQGVLGKNKLAKEIWEIAKQKNSQLLENYSSREILYTFAPNKDDFPDIPNGELFTSEEFNIYNTFTEQFYIDQHLPNNSSLEVRQERFKANLKDKSIWNLKVNDEIVSMAGLNAKYENISQIGGVFTPKRYRNKGYSQLCMKNLIHDCLYKQGINKLILFTGDDNIPAQKVYESVGFNRIGHYGMYFGEIK